MVVASWLARTLRAGAQEKDQYGTQEIGGTEHAEGVSEIPRMLVDVPNGQGAEVPAEVPERIH